MVPPKRRRAMSGRESRRCREAIVAQRGPRRRLHRPAFDSRSGRRLPIVQRHAGDRAEASPARPTRGHRSRPARQQKERAMSRQRNEQRGPARRRRVAAILVAALTVCGPLALTAPAGAVSGVPARSPRRPRLPRQERRGRRPISVGRAPCRPDGRWST